MAICNGDTRAVISTLPSLPQKSCAPCRSIVVFQSLQGEGFSSGVYCSCKRWQVIQAEDKLGRLHTSLTLSVVAQAEQERMGSELLALVRALPKGHKKPDGLPMQASYAPKYVEAAW